MINGASEDEDSFVRKRHGRRVNSPTARAAALGTSVARPAATKPVAVDKDGGRTASTRGAVTSSSSPADKDACGRAKKAARLTRVIIEKGLWLFALIRPKRQQPETEISQ